MRIVARERINPKGPNGEPVSMVRVGPQGDRVAFVVRKGPDAGLYVWTAAAGGKKIVALDSSSTLGASDPLRGPAPQTPTRIEEIAWSPDGNHLAYLRGGEAPGDWGEVGWASSMAAGELGRTPAVSFAWTPKGNALIVADPYEKAVFRRALAGSEKQKLGDLNDDFDPQNAPKIALSFDGSLIAATCRRVVDEVSEVWIYERKPEGGVEARLLTAIPGAGVVVHPLWAPRTPTIALYMVHLEQEKSAIVAVPRLEGEGIVLYEADFIDPAERPAWSPTGRTIAFFGVESARHEGTKTGPPRLMLLTEIASDRPRAVPATNPDEMVGGVSFLDELRIAVDGGDTAHLLTFSDPV